MNLQKPGRRAYRTDSAPGERMARSRTTGWAGYRSEFFHGKSNFFVHLTKPLSAAGAARKAASRAFIPGARCDTLLSGQCEYSGTRDTVGAQPCRPKSASPASPYAIRQAPSQAFSYDRLGVTA